MANATGRKRQKFDQYLTGTRPSKRRASGSR
jgi:hypothetical protein